jgi:hypothetical protein
MHSLLVRQSASGEREKLVIGAVMLGAGLMGCVPPELVVSTTSGHLGAILLLAVVVWAGLATPPTK